MQSFILKLNNKYAMTLEWCADFGQSNVSL